MDAIELMEWIAYYKLQDEEELEKLSLEVEEEKDETYHAQHMRNFLLSLKPSKKK